MNREIILNILYDLALVSSEEYRVEPLITKFVQRLLAHTSFPCGAYLSDIEAEGDAYRVTLHTVIGCGSLQQREGEIISLPREFIDAPAGLMTHEGDLCDCIKCDENYETVIKLPIGNKDCIILQAGPREDLPPYARIMEPVLKSFSHSLAMLRENESYTERLTKEVARGKELEQSLRESEQLLKAVLDTIPTRVFWKDIDSNYIGCNRAFAEDVNVGDSEGVIGKSDYDLPWGPQEAEAYRKDDIAVIESGESKINYEEPQSREQGELGWVTTSKIPLLDSEGNVFGILGTYEDITARKLAELKMAEAKHIAEKASRAKSDFLSSMSHELRTPLNAIMGFSQLMELSDPPLNDDNQESLHEILKASQHLLELINEVLDLAKVESGKIDMSIEPVLVVDIVNECIALLRPLVEKRGIQLFIEMSADTLWVQADKTRFKQILLNLLSNAVKYNYEQGRVTIKVRLDGEFSVYIGVQDTGRGLSPAQQEKLFTAFERLGADTTEIEGTGIGLVITKRLVEMMGGDIGVNSEIGKGSEFWIRLDRDESQDHKVSTNVETIEPVTTSSVKIAETKVLYIEDNAVNLKLVEKLFKRLPGVTLYSAHEPNLGLELAATIEPALILLDINLPGMDGYEVLARLKASADTSGIPVVAISANAMPTDIRRGLEAGFKDYLPKPIDVLKLISVTQQLTQQDK
ncbi:MAG: ATP-binding protein [Gammaproteobacteria bacterium]|nr:ATP-binding protein [Gammaproteobacteria bacterium]